MLRPLAIARRHHHGMADFAQQRLDLALRQRSAKGGLALLLAREDDVAQLRDDVLALRLRQQGGDGLQVLLDQVHGLALLRKRLRGR